jgi:hypothetical protein
MSATAKRVRFSGPDRDAMRETRQVMHKLLRAARSPEIVCHLFDAFNPSVSAWPNPIGDAATFAALSPAGVDALASRMGVVEDDGPPDDDAEPLPLQEYDPDDRDPASLKRKAILQRIATTIFGWGLGGQADLAAVSHAAECLLYVRASFDDADLRRFLRRQNPGRADVAALPSARLVFELVASHFPAPVCKHWDRSLYNWLLSQVQRDHSGTHREISFEHVCVHV